MIAPLLLLSNQISKSTKL